MKKTPEANLMNNPIRFAISNGFKNKFQEKIKNS